MLMLVLTLLAVGFILAVLLWAWTLWFQAYIYEQVTDGLAWRAPAVGGAILLLLIIWCVLVSRNPGVQPLFDITTGGTQEFTKLTAVKGRAVVETGEASQGDVRLTKDIVLKNAREIPYTLKHTGERRVDYVEAVPGGRPFARSDSDGIVGQIKVKDGDRDVVFQAELIVEEEKDKQGNVTKKVRFKPNKISTWMGTESDQGGRYLEVGGGRVMTDGQIGRVSVSAWGTFLLSMVLNVVHLAAWFVCLWLLLRYQWAHALGLAIVFWVVMTLLVVPMVLARVEPPPAPMPVPKTAAQVKARSCVEVTYLERRRKALRTGCAGDDSCSRLQGGPLAAHWKTRAIREGGMRKGERRARVEVRGEVRRESCES